MLLMLEDNDERAARFRTTLQVIAPTLPIHIWNSAYALMAEAGPFLSAATLISLDHDLEPQAEGDDPGDGYLVAKWLVAQPIVRPVIIHSSNGERSSWMAGEFDLANWRHWRVVPMGDDWIETDWRRLVKRLLKSKS
jgi:hypothetical protein